MDTELEQARPFTTRASTLLDRAESAYLKLLRTVLLIIATLLIGYAAFLATISLYRVLQSPNSVVEKIADVTAVDLAKAEAIQAKKDEDSKKSINPAHRRAYNQFIAQYHNLYRKQFEPFRQKEDKQLSKSEFDDNFIKTNARLEAIAEDKLSYESDITDLNRLLTVMTEAAALSETQDRLKKYKAANKVQVCHNVERTRTSTQRGWDRFSTNCPGWYYEPMGCAVTRQVQTPYTARECEMRFPEGTQSHTQLFRAYQDRFFTLLNERRERNASEAEAERLSILAGIEKGKTGFGTALQISLGFLMLMFFFLLIAIERHQRRIAGGNTDERRGQEVA